MTVFLNFAVFLGFLSSLKLNLPTPQPLATTVLPAPPCPSSSERPRHVTFGRTTSPKPVMDVTKEDSNTATHARWGGLT